MPGQISQSGAGRLHWVTLRYWSASRARGQRVGQLLYPCPVTQTRDYEKAFNFQRLEVAATWLPFSKPFSIARSQFEAARRQLRKRETTRNDCARRVFATLCFVMATQMLTVEGAAAALALHPETVRRMIKRGDLAAVKVGRHWRVPQSALTQLETTATARTNGTLETS